MHRILFSVFGLPVYAYGTALALAFVVAITLASRDAARKGIPVEIIIDIALALCLGGIIGGRLLYVMLEWGYYQRYLWEILDIRAGGMSFIGAALAGFAAAWWYVKRKGFAPWPLADLVVPYAALGYSMVRIGCLLNGCCYGVPSDLPWAFACREGDPLTPRHPTQIYASLGAFLLFLLLLRLRNHKRFPGFNFFVGMGLYAVMRGVIETFRDSQILWAGLHTTQVACLIMAAYAFTVIYRRERRRLREMKLEVKSGEEVGRGA